MGCLSARRQQWSFRLQQELKAASSASFLTLTYDDDNLKYGDGGPTLCKGDVQGFVKRLRTQLGRKIGKQKLRYYFTGEYGPNTKRPHYHGIMFNLPKNPEDHLIEAWNQGFVNVGSVTPASINYVTKYLITRHEFEKNGRLEPFSIMSLKPALGSCYLTDDKKRYHLGKMEVLTESGELVRGLEPNRCYGVLPGNVKVNLPRIYRDKLFSVRRKELIQNEQLERYDKKMAERMEKLKRLNQEYFTYDLEQKIQNEEEAKKRLTKNSKL